MPGITIYPSSLGELDFNSIHSFFKHYNLNVCEASKYKIVQFSPEAYPVLKWQSEGFLFLVEGDLAVEIEVLKVKLQQIAFDYFIQKNQEALLTFVENTVGEFLVYIINLNNGELLIFNDYLGRLPLYYTTEREKLIISREYGWLIDQARLKASALDTAMFLMLGFTIGEHTMFNSCKKLLAGSVLHANTSGVLSVNRIVMHRFDRYNYNIKSVETAANQLVKLFLETLKVKISTTTQTLSISGGLDSRAILAGFNRLGQKIKCSCYEISNEPHQADVQVSLKLAERFSVPIDIHRFVPASKDDEACLLAMKKAQNCLDMCFLIPFFKKIPAQYEAFWTGDGGDKVLPDLRPLRSIFSMNDLVNYIYSKHHILNYKEIESKTGVTKQTLKSYIKKQLLQYPETSLQEKYIHFIMMERAANWLFEGEDRNRYFVKSITPYYSLELYKYAMSIPNHLKKDFELFTAFLDTLDARLNTISNANWGITLHQTKKLRWIYFKQKIKSYLSIFITFENVSDINKQDYLETFDRATVNFYK
ncbi:MAG: hypothetical protein JXR60_09770 [Bacteroidales bacterium]|nr:hypothetical protein [Bacteroidales bacterium]